MAVLSADRPAPIPTAAVSVPVRPPRRVVWGVILLSLAVIGLCTEAAYLVASQQPEKWAARSVMNYRGEQWVETAAELMRTPGLLAPVAAEEGFTLEEFEERLRAGEVPGTQVLEYRFVSEDQQQALRIVDRLTDDFLAQFRIDEGLSPVEQRISERLEVLEVELAEAEALLPTMPLRPDGQSTPELQVLQTQIAALQTQIAGTEEELLAAAVEKAQIEADSPELVTRPYLLDEPVEPQPAKRAMFGALAGVVIAAALGFVILRRSVS